MKTFFGYIIALGLGCFLTYITMRAGEQKQESPVPSQQVTHFQKKEQPEETKPQEVELKIPEEKIEPTPFVSPSVALGKNHPLVGEWIECFSIEKYGIGRILLLKIRAEGTYSQMQVDFGPRDAPDADQTEIMGGMSHGYIDLATWKMILPNGEKNRAGYNEQIFSIKGDILGWYRESRGGADEILHYRRITPDPFRFNSDD